MMGWSDDLKVGDEVVRRCSLLKPSLVRVGRVTAKDIVIAGSGERYNRSTALGRGDYTFGRPSLEMPTPETRAEIRRGHLERVLFRMDWSTLSPATLERVAAIVLNDVAQSTIVLGAVVHYLAPETKG